MTDRLYYRDASLLEFDATVISHDGDPRRAVLDRTAFYPTSGGQPHDTGTLGSSRVIDVIEQDDRIVHVLDTPVALGPVRGSVDAARRHDHMEQHTAQHLISALAKDRLGWETASVHFGADHSTIEFDVATVSDADCVRLEEWTNAAIRIAVPVTVGFEDAKEAAARGLRKPTDLPGDIRVITIDGIDRSACGGTHVNNTSAIGPVVLRGVEKIRGHVRIGFLAGGRVLSHLHARDQLVHQLAGQLSCAEGELAELIPKRVEELKRLREAVESLEREVAGARVHALLAAVPPGPDGVRRLHYLSQDESLGLLRAMTQGVGAMERAVLVATTMVPPAILMGASADSRVDAGAVLKAALSGVGGRGGGSPKFAQGTVTDPTVLESLVERVLRQP